MIYGERIRQARELLELTQAALAMQLGVAQPTIAQIENGLTQPSAELANAIALATGFPLAFFRDPPATNLPLGTLLYRSRAAVSARKKASARRSAELYHESLSTLFSRVRLLPVRLPRLREDPVTAARVTRSELNLGPDQPIPNLIHAIEKAGVLVLSLPIEVDGLDAFAAWPSSESDIPVIATVQGAPGDRQRFSVAEELGHLVLHFPPRGTIGEMDREARRFAAELLLPEDTMRQELTPPITLAALAPLKQRWRVSLQVLIVRAHGLGILSPRQYKYLFTQLSARGWRKQEPAHLAIPAEKPRAPRRIIELVYGAQPDIARIATDLQRPLGFVRHLLDGYASRSELPLKEHPLAGAPSNVLRFRAAGRRAAQDTGSKEGEE
ncbi:MAG: ImmA/IrrE family metallo-endopeptidase [Chloroflexi bacterium]|nr:ImmA/IrrE family metallo-endopeptidase [Chloroflexota bacterium]